MNTDQVDPISNLKGNPVYIHSGNQDTTIDFTNQLCQAEFYNRYAANVKHVYTDIGHQFKQQSVGELIHHIYSNLPNSGISPNDLIPNPDWRWKDNGYLVKFDQRPYIQSTLTEFVKNGGSFSVNHHL